MAKVKQKKVGKKKTGRQPPTTKPGMSRETGQPLREPVLTVKVNRKLLPKIDRIGTSEKKKIFSILARLTTRRVSEEEAQAEIKAMLKQVKPDMLYGVANELIDFTARLTIDARTLPSKLIPQARNSLL
jgi:hypothetical protein